MLLPKQIGQIKIPPIKIQGIKTKLLPFIMSSIKWKGNGTWYEPFMGSGVVGFNVEPKNAIFSDTNPYIIDFYKSLQTNKITPTIIRKYLEEEGEKLASTPKNKDSYYYYVRERFNKYHNPLDFLFLQRSNFNGMIRFGPNGYNVPFGRKPNRFRQALITKIVNQAKWVQDAMHRNNWVFKVSDWKEAIKNNKENDFIYLDPPYIGRNSDYFNKWEDKDANELSKYFECVNAGYALSMWYQNKYRYNKYIEQWNGNILTNTHYYYFGGKERNRGSMIESLIVKNGFCSNKNKII